MAKKLKAIALIGVISAFAMSMISPPAGADSPQPRKIYSGWIPYYAMKTALPAALNSADLIKEVMPFWYTFKYNGKNASITDLYTPANPSVPISQPIQTMRNAGFLIIPTITDGTDKLVLANLLSTDTGRAMAVKVISDLVVNNSFDGIDLDFEGFAFVDGTASWDKTKPNWIAFVKLLSETLHTNGKLLSITTPYLLDPTSGKKGYYVYAWADIAPYMDRLKIMTYDYSVANPGPIGPINWTENTIKYAVSVFPSSRVFLGLAGYGRDWVTKVDGICPADVAKTVTASAKAATFIMSNAANLAAGYGATINYNESFQEATFTYQKTYNGNTATGLATSCVATRTAWYQDARAYKARAQLVAKYRLGGVTAWTIGFEDQQAMSNIREVALSIAPDQVNSNLVIDQNEFVYGTPINLTGRFTTSDKLPLVALPVHLEVQNGTDSNWREIAMLPTDSDGTINTQLYLGLNQSLRMRSDGTWERSEGITNIQTVTIKPQLKISAPSSVKRNSKISISGSAIPGAGLAVNLERFDGKWNLVDTTLADASGRYQFSYPSGVEPFVKLRISAGGSASVAVTVANRV